jgi:hypothetical protein
MLTEDELIEYRLNWRNHLTPADEYSTAEKLLIFDKLYNYAYGEIEDIAVNNGYRNEDAAYYAWEFMLKTLLGQDVFRVINALVE